MDDLRELLGRTVLFDRTAGQYVFCLLGILGTLVGRWVLVTLIQTRFKRWAESTSATWDDLLLKKARGPVSALLLVTGVYASLHILEPSDALGKGLRIAAIVVCGIIGCFLLVGLVDVLIEVYRPLVSKTESRLDDMILPVVGRILKVGLVGAAVLMVLHNVGIKVTALVTTAGIGGIAIAFGAQKVVANFFASLTIFSDQPFQVAERVRVSGITGVVEEIGLRSTRIRDDEGVLVTVPNLNIAEGIVENYSRRDARRVLTKIGVTYDTTAEQMRRIEAILAEIFAGEELVGDRFNVSFTGFSESSLDVQIIYWVKGLTSDILAAQSRINAEILRRLNEAGIEMAFPTRTLYHKPSAAANGSGS
jgi:MscS family membrane protein